MTDPERTFPFAGRRRKQNQIFMPVPIENAVTIKAPCVMGYSGRRGVFWICCYHDIVELHRHRANATVFTSRNEALDILQILSFSPRYTCLFVEPA